MNNQAPYLSVVIPVYNEAEIIQEAAQKILAHLTSRGWMHELLLVENGSRDATWQKIQELERVSPAVRGLRVGSPGHGDYGLALKTGALAAHGELVVNDEIDIGNFDFYDSAVGILATEPTVDMVIGSKTLAASNDQRPALRRFATWCVNLLLRVVLGFKGTDTHGLKVWRRTRLEQVVRACVTGKDILASELVIRAERAKLRIKEIPIEIAETRAARISIWKRIPHVLKNILELFGVFYFGDAKIFHEAIRYLLIAVFNVTLNASIFNALILASGITRGRGIFVFTVISYAVATTNGFFWNKRWVFKHRTQSTMLTHALFWAITGGMALFGAAMIYVLTTWVGAPHPISEHVWANIALLLTLPITFAGNFLGNKYLVFRSPTPK